jgi:hypothetical protein
MTISIGMNFKRALLPKALLWDNVRICARRGERIVPDEEYQLLDW